MPHQRHKRITLAARSVLWPQIKRFRPISRFGDVQSQASTGDGFSPRLANEELMSANEEILACNEERLSTNEELQTTKEELQSINEESRTRKQYEEQKHRSRELERPNRDLRSLLVGVTVATPGERGVTNWQAGRTVLVVDDTAPVRMFAAAVLRQAGFEVMQASGGIAGIAAFQARASEVRVVLLDITLPDLGGLEVAAELRKVRPDVPIVLMSGYGEKDVSAQLGGLKIDGFLHKPFDPDALLHSVTGI